MDTFADRLTAAITSKQTPATIALDPVYDSLPEVFRRLEPLEAVRAYCRELISLVAPHIPVLKINIAYFELFGAPGFDAYAQLVMQARSLGLLVIGDIKRGDVGHTAERYALAHLGGSDAIAPQSSLPDAVTISGYFGIDGVQPFINAAVANRKGVFVLVRTSNPSAAALQDAQLADGRKVHELLAAQVAQWAASDIGESGYSSIGAVVATRDSKDAQTLRAAMPRSWFLVPGYGAQGATAADLRPYFDSHGLGALIVAGRSVIFAHQRPEFAGHAWQDAILAACRQFSTDLAT